MVRCGPDINKAFNAVPGLKSKFPKSEGGEGKSIEELIGNYACESETK